jgi:hypothetical protein
MGDFVFCTLLRTASLFFKTNRVRLTKVAAGREAANEAGKRIPEWDMK